MRLPVSWLRELVDVRDAPEGIAERLVAAGFEVDAVERRGAPDTGDNHGHFRIGRVVHFERHPNADRLRLCQVDVGEAEPRQIVCGAANFAVDDRVVVALPNAVLPDGLRLKRARLRGETSDGMLLSERELQLSDEHAGIIVLAEDVEVGSLLRDHVALEEAVLDVAVESNRGDALSVYGLAREVAVAYGVELPPPPGTEPPVTGSGRTTDLVRARIEAPDRCLRFTLRGFEGVRVGPSPLRVRQRLAAAGLRPVSNVVDVTNYVAHELGNPIHAYDADRVAGGLLVARLARPGERVTTLDGRERALTGDMLVIASAEGPDGIAGVMGAAGSEIAPGTTRVALEVACFERAGIIRTSLALPLRTDASARFEKGVDPALAPVASRRAAELLVALCGARPLADPVDLHGDAPADPGPLVLRRQRIPAILGADVPDGVVGGALEGLGFSTEARPEGWTVRVPSWRRLDVTREIDLVEEVVRVHGLDRIPASLPHTPSAGGLSPAQRLRRQVEDALVGAGLTEAVTVSLVDAPLRARYGLAPGDGRAAVVALRNPLTVEYAELRTTLVPSLLEAVARNRAVGRRDVALFEVAHVYLPVDGASVPAEPWTVGAVVAGRLGGDDWLGGGPVADAHLATGLVAALLRRVGVEGWRLEPLADAGHLHPGRAARILVGDARVGEAGELHPAAAARFDLDGPVAVLELDLDALAAHRRSTPRYRPVPEHPPVRQDIAVVVADDVPAADVVALARSAGAPLLREAEVFDVYRDAARLGPGRVSLALRLVFRADDRTLTEDEASAARRAVVDALARQVGAELRG